MLQMMQKKIEAEGEKEEEIYEKFFCYCETGAATLKKSIEDAEEKIPQLESDIKETEAEAKTLVSDLQKHKTDREVRRRPWQRLQRIAKKRHRNSRRSPVKTSQIS